MTDKKINELDAWADLQDNDKLVVYDVSADKTVQMPVEELIPAGGSTGQVLKKASAAAFDSQWANLDPPVSALFNYVVTANTTYISTSPFTLPINAAAHNDISGASYGAGRIALPAGTYLIDASANFFVAGDRYLRLAFFNYTLSTWIKGGPVARAYTSWESFALSLKAKVVVPAGEAHAFALQVITTGPGSNVRIDNNSAVMVPGETTSVVVDLLVNKIA